MAIYFPNVLKLSTLTTSIMLDRLKRLISEFRDFWPEEYSSWKVLGRELNNRLAAALSSEDFETIRYDEREWDNMIILDACRYDTFERINNIEGDLSKVHSNASHTRNFLKKNFSGENFDTVYITASPMSAGYSRNFSEIRHLWKDKWNEENKTVKPEEVTDAAIDAYREKPDRKMLVHYMQPHFPFIGDKGDDIEDQGSFNGDRQNLNIWELLQFGEIDLETAKKAYEENLEIVLPEVRRLLNELEGKTIITSDHGNLFGKKVGFAPKKIYGHPPRLKDRELRSVPWLEIEGESRREVEEGEEGEEKRHSEEDIKKKLANLGYT